MGRRDMDHLSQTTFQRVGSHICYPYSVSSNRLRAGGAIRGRSVMHMDVQTGCSQEGVREAEEVPGNDRLCAGASLQVVSMPHCRDHEHSPSVSGLMSNRSAHPCFQECISSADITSVFFFSVGGGSGEITCAFPD